MYYVYILKQGNGQLYTGYTGDLKRRINEHQSGRVKSTEHRQPVELIHYEAYQKESDARRREKFLKTTEGKRLLRQQIRDVQPRSQIEKAEAHASAFFFKPRTIG